MIHQLGRTDNPERLRQVMAANDMRLPKVYTSTGEPGGASPISVAVCSGPEVSSAPGAQTCCM